ncbi:MAG: acetylxylan esterase, partial [Kiritimatiellae bacterium]|nr:acetylxylan esterase [Kiritimatiellia bacterium]
WNYLAYTVDMTATKSNVHGVKNGVSSTWYNSKDFNGAMGNSASDLCLCNLYVNNKDYSFNGKIDEVRISKTVRSDAWLKATYETIASTLALYRVGETDLPSDTAVSNLLLKAATDKENPIDYKEGDPITFNFRLEGVDMLPQDVQVKQPIYVIWTRTGDDGVTVKGTNTISLTQGFSATTSLAIPGIVRMTGDLVGSDYKKFSYIDPKDGKTTKYVSFGGGAGVATEKMQLSSVEPADFDQFWREAKAKLAAVPFNDQNVELVNVTPSSISNSYVIYAAKIPCFGPRPVTGWLTIPKNAKPGTLPIQATFDGYGCASAKPNPPTYGAGNVMRLAINAHGYDLVGHDNQYYKDFNDYINKTNRTFNGTTYGYACAPQDYDNPTNTYFYYMAMRVMRAYDYLKSRPEWDGTNVWASGGSQGGLQTMWAGGLVDGITKIEPSITWGCDIGCPWNGKGPYPSRTWGIPSVPGAYYFDSALHAKRVPRDCIANITRLGMGDYTCPPRGVLLSYYNMKCAVSAKLVQGSDHGYIPPQPNQQFTISKDAEPELLPPVVADADGFDWTNRVVTVTGAQAGKTVSLLLTGHDGTPVAYAATADSNGSAAFNVQTAPGASYSYTVTQEGAAPASGAFSTGSWKGSGTWFAGAVENGAPVASGGSWTGATVVSAGGNALEGDASFALDADAVAIGSNRLVRVDFDLVSGQLCLEAGLGQEEGALLGCVAAVSCTAGGNSWFAYDGSEWHRLYGDYALAENTAYIVRAELDLAQGAKGAVRYYVSDNAGVSFAPLFADAGGASAWIACNAADSRALKSVAAEGTKTLASVGGALMGADIAEADGVGYESLADAVAAATNSLVLLTNATWPSDTPVGTIAVNLGGHSLEGVQLDNAGKVVVSEGYSSIPGEGKINITLAQAAALGVATSGKSPAQIASALAENGANGIPLWKSYALGLDPADVTAKPKATIAMNGGNVDLRLVGITVNAASGATVTYKVYKFADLANAAAAEAIGGDRNVDATASVPKGAAESKMFYRLKVDVKGY